MTKNSNGDSKKRATPSQKRIQEQQRQQQLNSPSTSKPSRHLDVKVGILNEKNDSCKSKISSRLAEFSERASAIKTGISQALERQSKLGTADDVKVSATVEKLREQLVELTTPANDPDDDTSADGVVEIKNEPAQQLIEPAGDDKEALAGSDDKRLACEVAPTNEPANQAEEELLKKQELPIAIVQTTKATSRNSSNWFDLLSAQLDPKTKFVALKASLEKHFNGQAGELLEPVCIKLIDLTRQIDQLRRQNESHQRELGKLRLIKERLGDLCRELQKSNNQIRIESLNLIKGEQQKTKEQADKIQTTLAGVVKLFQENQTRNLGLREENLELQTKLKQLLEHCDNWEQCVETAIKQRDIENKLIKTELARASLVRTEEQERFFKEKQQLLKAIETMRQHQSRVEDKEAKLRSDLSSYASKYDQCQEMITNGLGKFQLESKRMLSQIERSRQDYVALLNKYETSNKKIKQLLEEKQSWMKAAAQANKKLEALEKLCRSLKSENDRLTTGRVNGKVTLQEGEHQRAASAQSLEPPEVPLAVTDSPQPPTQA